VPALEHTGQGLIPFFPLASGLLTGKYRRGEAAAEGTRLAKMPARLEGADWDRIEALASYAEKHGVSLLDVAIGGLASMPAVASVIAGATSVEQVHANARAGTWVPDEEQLSELVELTA